MLCANRVDYRVRMFDSGVGYDTWLLGRVGYILSLIFGN